jgi:transposase
MATSNEYSDDLRLKIVQAYQNDEGSQAKLATDFRVGKATVERLWSLFLETGSVAPLPHGGGNSARFGDNELLVVRKIAEKRPDATLDEVGALVYDITKDWPSQQKYKIPPSSSIISRAFKTLGITRKKKAALPPKEKRQKSKKRSESTKL